MSAHHRAQHRSHWILILLIFVHIVLGASFASFTPFLSDGITNGKHLEDIGAPDEAAHVAYVRQIYQTGDMPVLNPKQDPKKPTYENHQPPLFYIMESVVAWASGCSMALGSDAKMPLRLFNVLIGAFGVAGVWFFTRWLTHRRTITMVAAAIAALLPMNLALSGAVSNDPLLIALCAWSLAFACRGVGRSKPDWAVGAGLTAGAALLTKSTGILLLVPLGLAFYPRSVRTWVPFIAAVGIPILLGIPWWIRNLQVYGDPLGMSAFYATFPRQVFPGQMLTHPHELLHWAYVLLSGTALSFVGIFGYMDIHLPYWIYIPVLILLIAGGINMWRLSRSPEEERDRRAWVLNSFVILITLSFVSYNLWQVQPQARYLFPAMGPILLAVSRGVLKLPRGKVLAISLILLLFAADIYAFFTVPDQFADRVKMADQSDQL